MKPIASLLSFALLSLPAAAAPLDLSGDWRFALDPQDHGIRAKPEDWKFPDTIRLPGMVNAQGFGETPSMRTQWTGDGWRYPEMFTEWQADDHFKFPFFLQPPHHYAGPAWFQREVEIPAAWAGQRLKLTLERVKWLGTLWIDGKEAGRGDSLGTPHVFWIDPLDHGAHTLTLRLDNRIGGLNPGPLSHSLTDHTQGNWNGVVGELKLEALPANRIDRVDVIPSNDGNVRLLVTGEGQGTLRLRVASRIRGEKLLKAFIDTRVMANGAFQQEIKGRVPGEIQHWDEFSPVLYELAVTLGEGTGADMATTTFGFREARNHMGTLTLNGRRAFLRGTLECCIFPLTGHPPTDPGSWRRIIRICKDHGLNHIRFHSWCPPEAAFTAADELGFYLQPEASSWANQGAQIGSGMPLDEWIDAETARMIENYGNHPSFLLMAYGNEPAGPNHKQWLQDWVARWQKKDPRRLYTTGAGWPLMPGSDFHSIPDPRIQQWGQGLSSILNRQPPRTDFDWRDTVEKHPDAPIISHEIGQWCVYPDFDEIDEYTGHFKARNFEIFRETARRNGLLDQARDFLMASGKWQAAAYKHDIEAALRTPRFGGFQLLDLHDFPGQGTALVGVLDAFWNSKGYISAEEYARFCGPLVPLARLPKMVWQTDESLTAEIQFSHFGPVDLANLAMPWCLRHGGDVIASGKLDVRDFAAGALHDLGTIRVDLAKVPAPAMLTLAVGDPSLGFSNDWQVFVYQKESHVSTPGNVIFTSDLGQAIAALDQGGRVIWTPPAATIADDPERPLVAGFSPIFWNTAWTNWQPPHTLGILCDPAHPALASFPTQFHSNWQWWELQKDARPFILTPHHELKPLVQVIDDWFTNRKLGYVFEARVGKGHLIACAFDLESQLDKRPAARQLRASLAAHAAGATAPTFTLTPDALQKLLRQAPFITRATAESEQPGHEAALAIDGNPNTIWHTAFGDKPPPPPHDLALGFRQAAPIKAILLTQRQDRNANGQAADVEILKPDGTRLARVQVPRNARGHLIALEGSPVLDGLILRVHHSHSGPYASLAEVELKMAGN
jgi:hypothetical protein